MVSCPLNARPLPLPTLSTIHVRVALVPSGSCLVLRIICVPEFDLNVTTALFILLGGAIRMDMRKLHKLKIWSLLRKDSRSGHRDTGTGDYSTI